jgi:DNA uptake protein ComE-like DNA-binding protein
MWALVFFSILGAGLAGIISSQIKTARAVEDRFFSLWLARSAVAYAQNLITNDQTGYDTLYELKPEAPLKLGEGKVVYELADEEGRININTAPAEAIARLPGFDLQMAERVRDSALRPFHIKEEVLSVEGVSREAFDNVRGFITVHSNGKININTAPREVLVALGLEEGLADIICDFREGPDAEAATEDDGVFQAPAGIAETLDSLGQLSATQKAGIANLVSQGWLVTESENFSITAQAYMLGRPTVKYNIITSSKKIAEWRES